MIRTDRVGVYVWMSGVIPPKSGYSRDVVRVRPNAIPKNRNALAEFVRCGNTVTLLIAAV
jgi:hypothetical protein